MSRIGDFKAESVGAVTFVQLVALLMPVLFVALKGTGDHAVVRVAALIAALAWEGLFAALRRRGTSTHGVTTALAVAVLAPADIAVWQVMLAVALGVVLGELIFGGRGFGFVNPATLSLSLLVISFPQVQLAPPSQEVALATLPGAAVLLALGLVSWRIVVAVPLSVAALLAVQGQEIDPAQVGSALAFGLIFLISDPVSSATTDPGRWIYGALGGALIVVFSPVAGVTTEAVVFSALMASVFAPLIDHLVVLAHTRRKAGRLA